MSKNRPSNILVYVVISLIGLVGLFILGSFLESRDLGLFQRGSESSLPASHPLQTQVSDGR